MIKKNTIWILIVIAIFIAIYLYKYKPFFASLPRNSNPEKFGPTYWTAFHKMALFWIYQE